ncbi:DUF3467 domain-containing protein [Streptomyces sp. NPDC003480]
MNNGPDNQPPQEIQVEIPTEVETGVYADFVSIWHTPESFVLDFAGLRRSPELQADPNTGAQKAVVPVKIVSRVRIPPAQVFELMKALEQQLSAWEVETGQRTRPD